MKFSPLSPVNKRIFFFDVLLFCECSLISFWWEFCFWIKLTKQIDALDVYPYQLRTRFIILKVVYEIVYSLRKAAKFFIFFSGQSTKAFSTPPRLSGQENGYKKKRKEKTLNELFFCGFASMG